MVTREPRQRHSEQTLIQLWRGFVNLKAAVVGGDLLGPTWGAPGDIAPTC